MIHALTLAPHPDAVEISGTLRGTTVTWYAHLAKTLPAAPVYYAADETGILIPLAPDSECNHTFGGWPVPADDHDVRAATAERLCDKINVERDRREQTAFPYLGHLIDSDPISVQRITVAASTAQMALASGVPFELEWACADNSMLPLDATTTLGMVQALSIWGVTLHMHSRAVKNAIRAADYPLHVPITWPE